MRTHVACTTSGAKFAGCLLLADSLRRPFHLRRRGGAGPQIGGVVRSRTGHIESSPITIGAGRAPPTRGGYSMLLLVDEGARAGGQVCLAPPSLPVRALAAERVFRRIH